MHNSAPTPIDESNPFVVVENEGVYVSWNQEQRELTVQWIEDHFVHGVIYEPKSYFDGVWSESIRWLHKKYNEQQVEIAALKKLEAENLLLKEQLALSKQKIFGTSSEQTPPSEIDAHDNPEQTAPVENTPEETKKVKLIVNNRGRKSLPAHIPREPIRYSLPPEKQFCSCCDGQLHQCGEEVVERLSVVREHYKVIKHIQQKYVCRSCCKFTVAYAPRSILPGSSFASPEFLADVAIKRFQLGLPYYRQKEALNQIGLPFNRTTLANLMIGCADKMTSLYETLKDELRDQDIIHADETVFQVLKEPGRNAQTKSFLWQYRSGAHSLRPVVLFEYQPTRSGEHPRNFLNGNSGRSFKGYLCVDGYAGYNKLPNVSRVGCMAHVRRKFDEVIKSLPNSQKNTHAHQAIAMIGRLYAVEHKLTDQPPKRRYEIRQKESILAVDI